MKARCNHCEWLNYDFFENRHTKRDKPFCGLHGGHPVDPEGPQPNFDTKGSCGYLLKRNETPVQLTLNFLEE